MTLDSPIIPGFSTAKHAMLHQVPSSTLSVFPSYFAKNTEFFPACSRETALESSSSALLYAGKTTPNSRNISVA
jgi:hypothetical protein